jgi:hypothetical protein
MLAKASNAMTHNCLMNSPELGIAKCATHWTAKTWNGSNFWNRMRRHAAELRERELLSTLLLLLAQAASRKPHLCGLLALAT